MNHMKTKSRFVRVFAMIMTVFVLFMSSLTATAQAAPLYGWGSNGGSPSAANALASYVLATGSNGSASGSFVAMEALSRLNNKGGGNYAYGVNNNLDPFESPSDSEAQKAVTNIRNLYEHGYLQAFDNNADIGATQGTIALAPAALGASVFAMAFGLVQSLQQAIININPVNIFGLTDNSAGNITGGLTPQYGAGDGVFGGAVKQMFADAGVDANLIKAFAGLALTLMIALFAIALIHGLRNVSQGKSAFSKAGQLGLRIITIVLATPLTIVLISGLSTLSGKTFQFAYKSLGAVNDDLIVDTLQFAGMTNFDMSLLPDGGAGGAKDVEALNKALDSKNVNQDPNNIGIEKLVGYVAGNQTFTAKDYLAYLSNPSNGDVIGNQQSTVAGMKDQIIGYGKNYNSKLTDRTVSQVYDFSQNGADDKAEGNKDVKKRLGESDKVTTDKDDNANGSTSITIPTIDGKNVSFISLPSDKLGGVRQVSLDNPRTYLYAANAAKDGSTEELNTNSYVWGGKSEKGSMATHPWDGSQLTAPFDSDKDTPFVANAVARAYINANAGSNGNNFTNQSMVFLLQSAPLYNIFNGKLLGLYYKDATTGGTPGSEAASTGTNTVKLARYVIPYANAGDKSYLVGAYVKLNVTWVSAGWAALLGLLSLATGILFSAIVKSFKGFARGQFMGDFFGLLDMAIYLIGAAGSFMMFAMSVLLGSVVVSFFSSFVGIITGAATTGAQGIQATVGQVPIIGVLANGVSSLLTIFVMAFISLVSVAILTYPIMNLSIGNGENRSCNIVDLMITLPLSVAATISDWLNAKKAIFYGDGGGIPKMGESTIGGGFQKDSILGKAAGLATGAGAVGLAGAAVLGKGLAHAGISGISDGISVAKDAHAEGASFGDAMRIGGSTAGTVAASLAGTTMGHVGDTIKNFRPTGGNLSDAVSKHLKDTSKIMKSDDRLAAIKKAYGNFEFADGDGGVNNSENAASTALEAGMDGAGANGTMHADDAPLDAVVDGQAANNTTEAVANDADKDVNVNESPADAKQDANAEKSADSEQQAKADKKAETKASKDIADKLKKRKAAPRKRVATKVVKKIDPLKAEHDSKIQAMKQKRDNGNLTKLQYRAEKASENARHKAAKKAQRAAQKEALKPSNQHLERKMAKFAERAYSRRSAARNPIQPDENDL